MLLYLCNVLCQVLIGIILNLELVFSFLFLFILPLFGPRKTSNDTTKELIIYFSWNSLHGRLKHLLVLECFNTTKASHHHVFKWLFYVTRSQLHQGIAVTSGDLRQEKQSNSVPWFLIHVECINEMHKCTN